MPNDSVENARPVHLIRADGTELHTTAISWGALADLIGAEVTECFRLRDGRTVIVDDAGQQRGLPINAKATQLYLGICVPGTTYSIRGAVAIIENKDWR